MPLITSTTALNKIKWGKDRYDEGSSNQPYIKRDIPGVNVNDPNPTIVNDDSNPPPVGGMDFLWRGGLNAPIDAARDVSRLTQMFFDLRSPNGFEFIAKQNLLSRTAVKTEASYGVGYGGVTPPNFVNGTGGGAVNSGIYTPLSTLGQAAVGFTGTHLNLLGLDPSSPMTPPVGGGGGLFPGAGLRGYDQTIRDKTDPGSFDTKIITVSKKVTNPLWIQQIQQIPLNEAVVNNPNVTESEFILVDEQKLVPSDQTNFSNRLLNLHNIHSTSTSPILLSYSGGPGSILGIGDTDIMFADQRTGFNNPLYVSDENYFLGGRKNNNNPQIKEYSKKLGVTPIAAAVFPTDSGSLTKGADDAELQNLNTRQSTIRNAQLSNAGFFNPTGSNNYKIFKNTSPDVTSGSIDYENVSKLGASPMAAERFPNQSESIAASTENNPLQNINTKQSAIENAELITGNYAGFINATGSNNYGVFKNTSDGVTSGSIDFENVSKLGASPLAAEVFPNQSESIASSTENNPLQNINTKQSAIENAELTTGNYAGFINATGSNNYGVFRNTSDGVTSGSIDYLNPSKLGASAKAAEAFPFQSESIASATEENPLQNVNLQNNTINNPELETGLYAGFINPTGSNNFEVFKNTSDGVTSGSIDYERVKLPLLPLISASDSTNISDEAEYIEARDTGSIQNQNTPQSTFKNAKIDGENSFFIPDGPNNYKIFGIKDVQLNKQKIFIEGSSVSYAFASLFPSDENSIFEGLALGAPGGLKLFNNNVYDPDTLTTGGKSQGGAAWAQGTMTLTQAQIEEKQSYIVNPQITDFRKEVIDSQLIDTSPDTGISSVISLAPNYNLKQANKRINRGDPGKSNTSVGQKNVFNYGLPATQTAALDKITAMPMYDASGPDTSLAINDFCKFRIAAINNDQTNGDAVYMHFRAFIDSFSDSYNASWDPVNYSGRGESLYNYTGFNRGISMAFTCYAQSKAELIPMYKKLNYLASTLAPDYTKAGFMRGNLVRLTLGGYLYEQPGFITSLTYEIPQESPWEIAINAEGGGDGSVKELPYMIRVSGLSFTPIHNFLPQKPNNAKTPNERYIALSNNSGKGNYNDIYQMQRADGDGDSNNSNDILGE